MADMKNNYSENPDKNKPAGDPTRPKIEKVIKGEVTKRKKPLIQRIIEYFSGDDMQSVGQYVLFDVILPATKSLIFDAASQGLERRLFGTDRPRGSSGSRGWVPYNRTPGPGVTVISNNKAQISRAPLERPVEQFQDIVVEARSDAQEILDSIENYIDKYIVVTVADFYDMIGQKEFGTFTDAKWGWRSIKGFSIRPVSNGYHLIIPSPEPLDQ